MERSVEAHRLTWERVNLAGRYVELMTFKNKERKPVLRQVPMTQTLYEVLSELYANRAPDKEWVFWYRSYNRKIRTSGHNSLKTVGKKR